jgi:hypothetical protein
MKIQKLALVATTVAAISMSNVAPASAQHWHGGWGHGGWGHWHRGWGGPGLGFGLLFGALALGALASWPSYYGYPAYYGGPYAYYGRPYGYYGGPYYYGHRYYRWHRWHHWRHHRYW